MSDTSIDLFKPVLEIGGGAFPTYRPNMDIRDLPTVDIVANLEEQFPIEDESYMTIIGEYILEHVSWRKVPHFISECHRILQPGGKVVFSVPNTLEQCKLAVNTDIWTSEISNMLFGGQDYSDNTHKNAWSPEYALNLFFGYGFHTVIVHRHPVSATDMIIEAVKSSAVIRIG
jgi:predicted SAM-dependent methyltransferase